MRLDICLPIHNEAAVLEANSRQLLEFCRAQQLPFDWRIILIVNGSTDESAAIATYLAAEIPEILAIIKDGKGKGAAILDYWSDSPADVLCFMDADLATDLSALPNLLRYFSDNRKPIIAIGSRHLSESAVKRSWKREMASRFYNMLSRSLGHNLTDLQCGFKAITASLFVTTNPYIKDRGWFFDTELVLWAQELGGQVIEVPVRWQETREKHSGGIRLWSDSLYFIKSLVKLRRRLRDFRKQKS